MIVSSDMRGTEDIYQFFVRVIPNNLPMDFYLMNIFYRSQDGVTGVRR